VNRRVERLRLRAAAPRRTGALYIRHLFDKIRNRGVYTRHRQQPARTHSSQMNGQDLVVCESHYNGTAAAYVLTTAAYDPSACTHISVAVAAGVQIAVIVAWTVLLLLARYCTRCCRRQRRTHYGSSTEREQFRSSSEIGPTKSRLRSLTLAKREDDFADVAL
jgi:hypothetical protein